MSSKDKRKKTVSGFRAQLQWWLGAALLVLILAFNYFFFVRSSSDVVEKQPTLPSYSCPGKTEHYDSDQLIVYYRSSGCELLNPELAVKAGETLTFSDKALSALRLPRVPRPLKLGLYATGLDGGYQISGDPGEMRALAVAAPGGDEIQLVTNASKGAAALSISELAPALRPDQVRDLAAVYAAIASPQTGASVQLTPSQLKLASEIAESPADQIPERLVEFCSTSSCELSELTR